MRVSSFAILAALSLSIPLAFAQNSSTPSPPPAAESAAPSSAPPTPAPGAAAVPVPRAPAQEGKRSACREDAAAKGLRGQDRRDQIAVCGAQAQLDCILLAVDQKIVGPQRRDFMNSCLGPRPERGGRGALDQ